MATVRAYRPTSSHHLSIDRETDYGDLLKNPTIPEWLGDWRLKDAARPFTEGDVKQRLAPSLLRTAAYRYLGTYADVLVIAHMFPRSLTAIRVMDRFDVAHKQGITHVEMRHVFYRRWRDTCTDLISTDLIKYAIRAFHYIYGASNSKLSFVQRMTRKGQKGYARTRPKLLLVLGFQRSVLNI